MIFYQSKYHDWHFTTVADEDSTHRLPLNATFHTMNTPAITHDKKWWITYFRVGVAFNRIRQQDERVYFAEETRKYDNMPDVQVVWQ